jgi:hypothetical protein
MILRAAALATAVGQARVATPAQLAIQQRVVRTRARVLPQLVERQRVQAQVAPLVQAGQVLAVLQPAASQPMVVLAPAVLQPAASQQTAVPERAVLQRAASQQMVAVEQEPVALLRVASQRTVAVVPQPAAHQAPVAMHSCRSFAVRTGCKRPWTQLHSLAGYQTSPARP